MQNNLKLWWGSYGKKYESTEPSFFPIKDIAIATELEHSYAAIYDEAKILWQTDGSDSFAAYKDYSSYDDRQFPPHSWKKLVFMVWGIKNKALNGKFPVISSLLGKHPEVTSCFITKLSPHSLIAGHCGITNGQYRIHLGLKVPDVPAEVCGIEVGSEQMPWQNGKAFAFVDAHYHHVWNNTDEDRYLLIVDVCRPQFLSRQSFICARVIVSNLYFTIAIKFDNIHIYNISGTKFLDYLTYILYLPLWAIIGLNNKLGFIKL